MNHTIKCNEIAWQSYLFGLWCELFECSIFRFSIGMNEFEASYPKACEAWPFYLWYIYVNTFSAGFIEFYDLFWELIVQLQIFEVFALVN